MTFPASLGITTGCAPAEEVIVGNEIEEAVEDLYDALAEVDDNELSKLTSGKLARVIEEAEESDTLPAFCHPFKGVKIEIEDLDINGDEAVAEVMAKRFGFDFEHELELERDDGRWKASELRIKGETDSAFPLTMIIHADEAVEDEVDFIFSVIRNSLMENDIEVSEYEISLIFDESSPYQKLQDIDEHPPYIDIILAEPGKKSEAMELLGGKIPLGAVGDWLMATPGESTIRLTMNRSVIEKITTSAVEQVRRSIGNRLENLGIWNNYVRIQGDPNTSRRLFIEFSQEKGIEAMKYRVSKRGRLELRLVVYDGAGQPITAPARESLLDSLGGNVPLGMELVPEYEKYPGLSDIPPREAPRAWYLLYKDAPVNSNHIQDTRAERGQFDDFIVGFTLNAEGAERMRRLTRANIGKLLAVVLDDKCLMAATIQEEIGEKGQITGSFSQEETETIAFLLRSGSLPVSIHLE